MADGRSIGAVPGSSRSGRLPVESDVRTGTRDADSLFGYFQIPQRIWNRALCRPTRSPDAAAAVFHTTSNQRAPATDRERCRRLRADPARTDWTRCGRPGAAGPNRGATASARRARGPLIAACSRRATHRGSPLQLSAAATRLLRIGRRSCCRIRCSAVAEVRPRPYQECARRGLAVEARCVNERCLTLRPLASPLPDRGVLG